MHYGTENDPTYDAPLFEDHLHEIRECHRVSRGCFFLVIIFAYCCNVYENESSKSYLFIYVYLCNCGRLTKLSASHTTRVGTVIVATIYLQLIQNRYLFRSFTVLHCSHQHCVQPVASDMEVVEYL